MEPVVATRGSNSPLAKQYTAPCTRHPRHVPQIDKCGPSCDALMLGQDTAASRTAPYRLQLLLCSSPAPLRGATWVKRWSHIEYPVEALSRHPYDVAWVWLSPMDRR